VAGEFAADDVGGDLYVRDTTAGVRARAGGDVILTNLAFSAEYPCEVEASGDILCRLPSDASVRFSVRSGGDVSVRVPGAQVADNGGREFAEVVVGAGAAQATLRAGGDVALSGPASDLEGAPGFADDFERGFDAMAEGITARVQKAAEHTRRKGEAARRRAEVKIEAALRRARAGVGARPFAARRASWDSEAARSPIPPAGDPVSNDERLTILRMVEHGKITAADAEKLLAALEGSE